MFSCIISACNTDEEKRKVLEDFCDSIELSKDELVEAINTYLNYRYANPEFRQAEKALKLKESFEQQLREIYDKYSLRKIDSPIYDVNLYGICEKRVFLYCSEFCIIMFSIVAEQIRLRNYNLEYVGKIPDKFHIYLNIYRKRYGDNMPHTYMDTMGSLLNADVKISGLFRLPHLTSTIFYMVCAFNS